MTKLYRIRDGKLEVADGSKKNIGDCFFCSQPVFAAPGQAVKYLKVTGRDFPTHKTCRP